MLPRIRSRGRAVAVVAFLALVAAGGAGADTRRTETVRKGTLEAELTYVMRSDFGYRDAALTVRRAGRVVFDRPLAHCRGCDVWPAYGGRPKSVAIRDLDRDGEPEILVHTYTGGAHCCSVLYAFRWTGRTYVSRQLNAASAGYRQRDLNGDGRPEWIGTDARFEYLFTAYVNSVSPIRIWTYRNGAFVPVTRSFPAEVRKDERSAWRLFLRHRGERDVRGVLAAWAADKYLLGEGDDAWPAIRRAVENGELAADAPPAGAAYVRALGRALERFGYTKFR